MSLIGTRIGTFTIRPIIQTDEGPYMELHADPEVVEFMGPPFPKPAGQLLKECYELECIWEKGGQTSSNRGRRQQVFWTLRTLE